MLKKCLIIRSYAMLNKSFCQLLIPTMLIFGLQPQKVSVLSNQLTSNVMTRKVAYFTTKKLVFYVLFATLVAFIVGIELSSTPVAPVT